MLISMLKSAALTYILMALWSIPNLLRGSFTGPEFFLVPAFVVAAYSLCTMPGYVIGYHQGLRNAPLSRAIFIGGSQITFFTFFYAANHMNQTIGSPFATCSLLLFFCFGNCFIGFFLGRQNRLGWNARLGFLPPWFAVNPRVKKLCLVGIALFFCVGLQLLSVQRSTSNRKECEANLLRLSTALNMYGADNQLTYPEHLEQLQPGEIIQLPTCPSAGRMTYDYEKLPGAPGEQSYTIWCSGMHHAGAFDRATTVTDYPKFSKERGKIDPPGE